MKSGIENGGSTLILLETEAQRGRNRYCHTFGYRMFIFLSNSDAFFFSLDSLWKYHSVVCQRIWCSSYRFRDIRDQKGLTPKIVTFLILHPILTNFLINVFVLMSTKRICQLILAVDSHFGINRGQRGQKRYFYKICIQFFYPIWMRFFLIGLVF